MVPETNDRPASPPTRANLKAWWKQFNVRQKTKKPEDDAHPNMVFGVPLKESLRYASVQISTANADGEMYVWGYIPVVVAKCGLYLKERATETEGVFRVSGSSKRMKELQAVFERSPRYGKSLDWKKETYTTHDVASVFRRYLTMMPEPVVPTSLYHEFRNMYGQKTKADDIITEYKRIIKSMPRANQYLLLYVLDLLSVFARKSDKNLMPASNLAVIFRPGILAHPDHHLLPAENELSQRVLEFLIDHQDWFMLDIPPPPRGRSQDQELEQHNISSSTITKPSETDEELVIVPSSEEEHTTPSPSPASATASNTKNDGPTLSLPPSGGGGLGGWKLISRRTRRGREKSKENGPIIRSKSNIDRQATAPFSDTADQDRHATMSGELSPVPEKDGDVVLGSGAASVGRSQTLPSVKTPERSPPPPTGGGTAEKEPKDKNVLRKIKKGRPISVGNHAKPKDQLLDRPKEV